MLLSDTLRVTPTSGPRPGGAPDRCFYCNEPLGALHADGCARRRKVVMVRVSLTFPRVVPASWDGAAVDFELTESSWCASNIVADLNHYLAAQYPDAPCLCEGFTGEYLRDATPDDVQGLDLPTLAGLTRS